MRSICRIKNITAKRITKPLLQEVVEVVVSQVTSPPQDHLLIYGFARQILRESVDIVSWKGNVEENTSHEAKRQKRDDEEIRHGTTELVDDRILNLVEDYWLAIGESKKTLMAQGDPPRAKMQTPVLHCHVESPSASSTISSPPPPLATIANAAVPVSSRPPLPLQQTPDIEPTPKSSISKNDAFAIIDSIVHYIVEPHGESDLLTGCLSVLDRCWPMK